jgi:hypothetical protein
VISNCESLAGVLYGVEFLATRATRNTPTGSLSTHPVAMGRVDAEQAGAGAP